MRKYGEAVCIDPNIVAFSSAKAIPQVYTTRTEFPTVCDALFNF